MAGEDSNVAAVAPVQQRLDTVHLALELGEEGRAADLLYGMSPAEVALLLEGLPGAERDHLWQRVPDVNRGAILASTSDTVRSGLLRRMAPGAVAVAIADLEVDDAVDIIQDLPGRRAVDHVLRSMDEQDRERLAPALAYEQDKAGGLMDTNVVSVRADDTLETVSHYLRGLGSLPEGTDNLMVVDRENQFLGTLPLRVVLTGPASASVGECMETRQEAIPVDLPVAEVSELFTRHDLVSAPVVDKRGRLLGRITVDDVVDVIRAQAGRLMLRMGGLMQEEATFSPVWISTCRRAVWLGINLATAFLAAWVIAHFESTIQQVVALAVLMPVVASMGGIAGSQTLTIMVRGLALGQIARTNVKPLLFKELAVGALNGLVWALAVGWVGAAWFDNPWLGVVFGLALLVNLIVAALAGVGIPLGLRALGIDPALAGGVLLTTVTDVIGFMCFLGLGALVLL